MIEAPQNEKARLRKSTADAERLAEQVMREEIQRIVDLWLVESAGGCDLDTQEYAAEALEASWMLTYPAAAQALAMLATDDDFESFAELSGHLSDYPQAALAHCVIERHLIDALDAAEAERG